MSGSVGTQDRLRPEGSGLFQLGRLYDLAWTYRGQAGYMVWCREIYN